MNVSTRAVIENPVFSALPSHGRRADHNQQWQCSPAMATTMLSTTNESRILQKFWEVGVRGRRPFFRTVPFPTPHFHSTLPSALLILAALLCSGLVSLASAGSDSVAPQKNLARSESVDLFPDKASVRFARCFTIAYHGTYKRLEVSSAWRNSKETFVYILVPRGQKPPPDLPQGATVIQIPVERIAIYSVLWLPFFPMLDIEDRVVGLAGCDSASTPEIRALIRQGRIQEIGIGGRGMRRPINMERLMVLKPEAVMIYGTGTRALDQTPKLLEAGFNPVLNASHMEPTPLGHAEWVKFIAAFFNKEVQAERVFDGIVLRYNALAQKTRTVCSRPTVICGVGRRGTWHMPGGRSYVAQLIADAGAEYKWGKDATAGLMVPVSVETVFDRAKDAQYWIDTTSCRSLEELRGVDERYVLFSAFRSGKVFNNDAKVNAGGGNDFWETGFVHPDMVLADLISVFHPELIPDHQRTWYRQLPSRTEGHR